MDPGEILRGHHISNFGKEITRDNRLFHIAQEAEIAKLSSSWPVPVQLGTEISLNISVAPPTPPTRTSIFESL